MPTIGRAHHPVSYADVFKGVHKETFAHHGRQFKATDNKVVRVVLSIFAGIVLPVVGGFLAWRALQSRNIFQQVQKNLARQPSVSAPQSVDSSEYDQAVAEWKNKDFYQHGYPRKQDPNKDLTPHIMNFIDFCIKNDIRARDCPSQAIIFMEMGDPQYQMHVFAGDGLAHDCLNEGDQRLSVKIAEQKKPLILFCHPTEESYARQLDDVKLVEKEQGYGYVYDENLKIDSASIGTYYRRFFKNEPEVTSGCHVHCSYGFFNFYWDGYWDHDIAPDTHDALCRAIRGQ